MLLLDQQNPKRNMKLVASIFALASSTLYCLIVWVGVANLIQASESVHWPTTSGYVTVAVESKQIYEGAVLGHIWYEYTLGGKTWRSERVNFFERGAIEKYKEGEKVLVHYQRSNPSEACLVPGIQLGGALNVTVAALGLLAAGVGMVTLFISWLRDDDKVPVSGGLVWLFVALLR